MNMKKRNLDISTLNKRICLGFNLVPGSVVYDKLLLRYESFCRYTHFLYKHIVDFHIMGRVNCSRQYFLSQFVLCYCAILFR